MIRGLPGDSESGENPIMPDRLDDRPGLNLFWFYARLVDPVGQPYRYYLKSEESEIDVA